jgi:monovalent cation:H+ antiporter-2, CPA2 family
MSQEEILIRAFLYLLSAVIMVPIAKKLGLGSVLGYLFAGIALGSYGFNLLGGSNEDIMHFAEFGVVMMLFLIGLELKPSLLWQLRNPIMGLGGLQVVLVTLLFTGAAFLFGFNIQESFALGLILSLSSTAIALQTLAEKGLMKTEGGKASFAILLFQDIAVIPMFAVLPLLATHAIITKGDDHHGEGLQAWLHAFPNWLEPIIIIIVILAVIFGGRFLTRPLFRFIASTRMREVFTAAALFLVIGVALAMQSVGLSPALGAFLAGVVLAESEYRQELETVIEPFKGLFLGLFFISVGAAMDFSLLGDYPVKIIGYLLSFMLIKGVVIFLLSTIFKIQIKDKLLVTLGLCGGGEFAFVLFSFAKQNGILSVQTSNEFTLAVALSMALTPLLFVLHEKVLSPRIGNKTIETQSADSIEEQAPVIIAGFGRFGNIVGRMLQSFDIPTIVLDHSASRVESIRKLGLKAYYGDASRMDLLHSAGVDKACLFIIAIDEDEKALEMTEMLRQHYPKLKLLVRASGRQMAIQLKKLGVENIYRETLDTSLKMAEDALVSSGVRAHQAHKASLKFRKHDEESLNQFLNLDVSEKDFFSKARALIQGIEQELRDDTTHFDQENEAWNNNSIERNKK